MFRRPAAGCGAFWIDGSKEKTSTCRDMKLKHWMFLALALSTAAALETLQGQAPAQPPADPQPPVVPASDVPAPLSPSEPKKAQPKKAAKAKAATKTPGAQVPSAPLSPGPAVAKEKNVNLRGQAAINSEIVTRIKRGDLVTVLEEVTLKKPKQDEPARWAKVTLPAGSFVWVNTHFIDPNKKVAPRRLNLRSGPGENYSIVGRIDRGTDVKDIEVKGDWMKIEAPTNSYAFIAAHLLSTDPADLGPALAKANPPPPAVIPPPPVETAVVAPPPPPPTADPLTNPPAETAPPVVTPPPPPAETVATPPPPAVEEEKEEDLPKRIVTREGIVKGSASIQAPSYFVLRSLDNNKTINYLFAPDTNIVMKEFHLQRVLVRGEELLDERWPNTPVINIESIEVVP